jgi:4-hydroxybenzoate polyprenyltransferase
MVNLMACKIPWWPMGPIFGAGVLLGILAIAGVIFSPLWFYFLGAIAYFFVVKKVKPAEDKE